MKIWVYGDGCPKVIKEILYKAAEKRQVELWLVANRAVRVPRSPYLHLQLVPPGQDAADAYIASSVAAGDLVVTSDIPLAAQVVAKGGLGLNPRGELYTLENIQARLSSRNFMDELRANGVETGGPSIMTSRDRRTFANTLDRLLTRRVR